jgi:uncharacterized protein (TIGR02145 family)
MKKIALLLVLLFFSNCSRHFISYHGHRYPIIPALDQWWMAENLATDSYRSGRHIPLVTSDSVWTSIQTPACCYYDNDTSCLWKYGMLYNWYAVEAGHLCPLGWKIPSDDDWLQLEKFLGGGLRAGGRLKSVDGWKGRPVSADDIGFKALPGGYRLNESFSDGYAGMWWSSTPYDTSYVWGRRIDYNSTELINTLNNRQNGFSVRCMKEKGKHSGKK